MLNKYTAFCTEIDAQAGATIWIATVEATSKKEALQFAIEKCADDWECEPADVVALGLVEGDVKVAAWLDGGYSYGETLDSNFEV
jgi:hypothetical protein